MSRVEAFAAGSRLNQVIKAYFGAIKGSRSWGCNLTFDSEKSSDQEPQKGTIKHCAKHFHCGCKRFNK